MNHENLESDQNIHAIGIGYVYNYLSREGYTIYEVNTDPNHHFQLFAKRNGEFVLIAVCTAFYPDIGTIDKAVEEQLNKEADQRNATPHFAGLAVAPLETNNLEIDGLTGGKEYRVTFEGIAAI